MRMRMRFAACTSAELRVWTGLSGAQFLPLIKKFWQVRPDRRRGHPGGWRSRPGPAPGPVVSHEPHPAPARLPVRDLRLRPRTASSPTSPRTCRNSGGPPPKDKRELWIADGTLIPVHDQKRTKKSKNYRRGVNVQVIARARDRRVIAVGDAWPGDRNDIVVRETLAKDPAIAGHRRPSGDGGHRGRALIRSPARRPDGKIIRDRVCKWFRRRRAIVEQVLARLKDYQILRQCRREGAAINDAGRGVAVLHDLKIDVPA